MTTYKLIVPIKCKTIHKAWKTLGKISESVAILIILTIIGFLNGFAFYIPFHSEEVRNYVLSNGGSLMPGAEYLAPFLISIVDIIFAMILLSECNINFKIGCIKEGGEE